MRIHTLLKTVPVLVLMTCLGHASLSLAQTPKEEEVDKFGLDASLGVLYGDWNYGDYDLDSRLGMVGLGAEVWFLGKKLGIGGNYISGDFDGEDVVSLEGTLISDPDDNFGSRKQMTHSQSREDIYAYAMWRPLSFLVLEAGYKYLDYDFRSEVDLVSDARQYGTGLETQRSEARGFVLGLRAPLKLASNWTLALAGRWMPELQTEVQGTYAYALVLEDRTVSEQWTHNGTAEGIGAEAILEFHIPKEPVVLRLGYVFQKTESGSDVQRSWVDEGLGLPARDWLTDQFQGVLLGASFRF